MRSSITSLAIGVAIACAVAGSGAQEIRVEQSISGDMIQFPGAGRQFKTGTGVIRGRVLALETGTPIRRAQVRISGQEVMPKAALTDGEGRFEFRDLPAGRFTLQASKSGYVSVQFGQTRPYESGRPIELADKQVLENSDIAMPRGSVISGRIVDEFGEPIPDVAVTAMRQSWSGGRRRLVPAPGRMAQTNDLGQFRLYGLPPGEYYISATIRAGAAVEMMAFEPATFIAGTATSAPGPSASTPSSGYAPTYYPGTTNVGEAQKITLLAGQEHQSADFSLVPVRLARVSGIVIGSDGRPVSGAMVNLTSRDRNEMMMIGGLSTARTNQEGAFTINSVAPGDYLLQANQLQVTLSEERGDHMVTIRSFGPGGGGPDTESGSLPLTVAGEDVPNLVVQTAKGGRATGRVTFEDGAKPPNVGSIRISSMPVDSGGPVMSFGGSGAVKPDGTFELAGLSGIRLIRVPSLPPGWTLKEVRLNGTDITDTGAEFRPGEAVSGLEVVLTSRTTSVTGGVTGSDGSPVKDYTLVIFADNADLWRLPMTRWVTGTRPDQEGRFKVQNLPPGSYHAVAVEYIPQGEWGDPDLLERLKGKGHRFTLSEGSTEVLDLKIVY
jgi:protocatechuate 3,4-dioxygenase beta subunit